MKTKLVQTKLQETLWNQLKKKAEDEERSLSSLIRVIVKDYLGYDVPAPGNTKNSGGNATIEFKCKTCGWKSYPGATIRQNRKGNKHYCPECDSILNAEIEVEEQAFMLKNKK